MSMTVDQSFVQQFEADVFEAFQRRGSKLLGTVRRKMNVVGKSTTFQKVGKGTATTKARHGVIPPMNQDHTPVTCFLEDLYAGDWVDKLDELKLNIDERQVIANAGAWALGRAIDDDIITRLDATTEASITGAVGTAVQVRNFLLRMVEALDANDVPNDGQRWGALTPRAWNAAMTVAEFVSSDYVGDELPYINPRAIRSWNGVNWMMHTGLPNVGAATAKVFAWHMTAVGYATGQEITSDITWHGDRAAHFVNNSLSGGGVLVESEGVIEGTFDDTTAIPTS